MPAVSYAVVVGRAFRFLRESRGIQLGAVAQAAGVSVSGWSRVETGDTTMTVQQLRVGADAIGARPTEVLEHAEQEWLRQRAPT